MVAVPPALAPHVAALSVQGAAGEEAASGPVDPYKVLPKPFPVLGFQIRGRLSVLRGSTEERLARCGITGLCTSPRWFRPDPGIRTVLVTLQPGGVAALFGHPLSTLVDGHVALSDLLSPRLLRPLEEQLAEASSDQQATGLVGDFLLSLAERSRLSLHPAVQAAARWILSENGREPVESIAARLQISRRQLERLFRLQIGFSPKRFSSLVRFDWVARHLDRRTSWTDLALEAGYADQAHLIRSFSRLAGTTPERHVRGPRPV